MAEKGMAQTKIQKVSEVTLNGKLQTPIRLRTEGPRSERNGLSGKPENPSGQRRDVQAAGGPGGHLRSGARQKSNWFWISRSSRTAGC
ncbi:MAG: hypothetical protein MZV64_02730 [Ignavibacteriales bacterium]|nr:hypothetical protein [Ignavibacteriales bacterium]